MNRGLQAELLEFIINEGDIHNSPRAYKLYNAVSVAESQTELCRELVKAFIIMDKDLKDITEELIDERLHSTRTIIRPNNN